MALGFAFCFSGLLSHDSGTFAKVFTRRSGVSFDEAEKGFGTINGAEKNLTLDLQLLKIIFYVAHAQKIKFTEIKQFSGQIG